MEHEKCIELISSLIDGELSDAESTGVREHIASCPECRRVYEAFSAVSDSLCESEDVPDGLHEDIISGIKRSEKKRPRLIWLKSLSAAACLALVLFAGARAGMFTSQSNELNDNASGQNEPNGVTAVYQDGYDDDGTEKSAVRAVSIEVTDAEVAKQLALLLEPSGEDKTPPEREPDMTVAFTFGDDLTPIELYFNGQDVYVDYGNGAFHTKATADEIKKLLS